MAAGEPERLNGDERRRPIYHACPEAFERLNIFHWQWLAAGNGQPMFEDSDTARQRVEEYRAWIRRKRPHVDLSSGITNDGLLEACETIAAAVQHALHELPSPLEPLDVLDLGHARIGYLKALRFLGGQKLAKEVEARVAPHGQPLAICIGSAKDISANVVFRGHANAWRLQGFAGCRRVFPDPPYGPGRRWPTWCPDCKQRKSNARDAEIAELRRRVARG